MKLCRLLPLLLLVAFCAFAQEAKDDIVGSADAPPAPKYFVAGGASTTPYGLPIGAGFLTFGIHLGGANYTYSHLVMSATKATLSQGFLRRLTESEDHFSLSVIGDAGLAAGAGLDFTVAGGVVLGYDISRFTKIAKTSAIAVVKVQKLTGIEVSPTFSFGISKSF